MSSSTCLNLMGKMHGLKGNSLPFSSFNLNDRLKGNSNSWENRLTWDPIQLKNELNVGLTIWLCHIKTKICPSFMRISLAEAPFSSYICSGYLNWKVVNNIKLTYNPIIVFIIVVVHKCWHHTICIEFEAKRCIFYGYII